MYKSRPLYSDKDYSTFIDSVIRDFDKSLDSSYYSIPKPLNYPCIVILDFTGFNGTGGDKYNISQTIVYSKVFKV